MITQLTDEPDGAGVHSVTKTPDSQLIVYVTANKIKALDTVNNTTTLLYE